MKKLIDKVIKKREVKSTVKLKNNNKGFSLIELLIVIAIMGVLAAIAFSMFGGVLVNSKKRADDQMARNLEKAITTYCVDSGDWNLKNMSLDLSTNGTDDVTVIKKLLVEITDTVDTNKTYGPILSRKDPTKSATDAVNVNAYLPQWNAANDGEYVGWDIVIYPKTQTVTVKPLKQATGVTAGVVKKGTEATGTTP